MDAGEVKARVVIEYDGSGLVQAKEDLASLGEMGGAFGSGGGGAGGAMADFGKQLDSTAAQLARVADVGYLAGKAFTELTAPIGAGQQAISGFRTAIAEIASPLADMPRLLQAAQSPFLMLAEHAGTTVEQIGALSDSFAQLGQAPHTRAIEEVASNMERIQTSAQQATPLLSTWASSLDEAALATGDQYVTTGKRLSDFTQQVSQNAAAMQGFSQDYADYNKQIAGIAAQVAPELGLGGGGGGAGGGEGGGGGFFGNLFGEGGFLGGFGGTFSDLWGSVTKLGQGMMEIMWPAQMIGQAIGGFGQSMYNAAVIAEGPAAHSFSTFTGQLDALGKSSQQSFGTFSDSFGKQMMPSLGMLNAIQQGGGGTSSWWGNALGFIGNALTMGSMGVGGLAQFISSGGEQAPTGAFTMGPPPPGGWGPNMPYTPTGQKVSMPGFNPYGPAYQMTYGDPGMPTAHTVKMDSQGNIIPDTTPQYTGALSMGGQYGLYEPALFPTGSAFTGAGPLGGLFGGIGNMLGGLWNNLFGGGQTGELGGGFAFGGGGGSRFMGLVPGGTSQFGGGGLGEAIGSMLSSAMSNLGSISMPSMSLGGITSGISSMLSSALSGLGSISMPSVSLGGITSGIGGMLSSALSGLSSISMPSISLGGIASGVGSMLSSALSGLSGISLPSINLGGIASGVGSMLSSALGGLSGISLPSINLGGIAAGVGAMLSSALSGLSGISLPSINLGGIVSSVQSAISGALSALSNISIPGIHFFAGGVQNFGGGLAVVGDAGPELLQLPAGSSVYPMSTGAGVSASSLAGGIGDGFGGGGGGPITVMLQVDGQTLMQATAPYLAPLIRMSNGSRRA